MSTLAQVESSLGLRFTPFDDSQQISVDVLVAIRNQVSSGYDTRNIDAYRQGVEINSSKYLFNSTQPKLWTGNIFQITNITTYGQARSWTEYSNNEIYDDEIIEFNPVQYIIDQKKYPFPIYFNNGPMQEEEAIIEPFTVPFRKDYIWGANPPRQVHAELEDGNNFSDPKKGSSFITQFIEYNPPLDPYYFLDDGQQYFGTVLTNSIRIDGYSPVLIRNIDPFNDTNDEKIVAQISSSLSNDSVDNMDFIDQLKLLHLELDDDIRETYNQKSATAGYSVYGPQQAIYGTDSIAYNGWLRGS
jgi:hypothetical protein